MKKQNKGITLVALVITIIILLILAGITISTLTQSGLFGKAKEAKEQYSKVAAMEKVKMEVLASYDASGDLNLVKLKENITGNINGSSIEEGNEFPLTVTVDGEKFIVKKNGEVSHSGKGSTDVPADPTVPTNPATSIDIAKTDDMLNKTVNSPIEDANGNKITIPAGFKIKVDEDTNNATTVDKGIVIVDSEENEFVWIPVPEDGKIYINAEKTEYKEVTLNRYTFDSNGNPTAQNDAVIDSYYQEVETSTYGNTTAKSITNFKQSVADNKGYYIGRYEARTGTARSAANNPITPITVKGTDSVYNYVTQMQAAELAQNMYDNTKPFTSDLINSYAWDTATLFLQSCGTNSKYSKQNSVNTTLVATGTNNQTTKDIQCNVYDMASNIREWTTETSSISGYPCISRGGDYSGSNYYAGYRSSSDTSFSGGNIGVRPLLYL